MKSQCLRGGTSRFFDCSRLAKNPEVLLYDAPRDVGPEILLADSLLGGATGRMPQGRVGDQHAQQFGKGKLVADGEGVPDALHQFAVFGNVAGDHAQAGTHGIQQSQG